MREILLRIKRGELQLFNDILNEYLPLVYNSVAKSLSRKEADKITVDIFIDLYKKIQNYHIWNNPDTFIEKNIRRNFSKYNIIICDQVDQTAPPIVLRNILIALSNRTIKKKRIYSLFLVPLTVIVISIFLMLYYEAYSAKVVYPMGTIEKEEELTISAAYRDGGDRIFTWGRNPEGVVSVESIKEDLSLVYAVDRKNEYFYKLYKGANFLKELEIDFKYLYQTYAKNNTLVFKHNNSFYRFNYESELVDSIITNNILNTSDNNRYVLIENKDSENIILDLYEFKEITTTGKSVKKLLDSGKYLTEQDTSQMAELINLDLPNSLYNDFHNNYLVNIDKEGFIKVIRGTEVVLNSKLFYYHYLDEKETSSKLSSIYVEITNDLVLVAIEGEIFSGLEAFDLKTNDIVIHFEDTVSKGEMEFRPVLSNDKNAYLISIQKRDYRDRVRQNIVFNLAKRPITALKIPDSEYLEQAAIGDRQEGGYYVYSINNSGTLLINIIK